MDEQEQATASLDEVLRTEARRLLAMAIETESQDYVDARSGKLDAQSGHRQVVRNGYMTEREILTPIGSMDICQSRVRGSRKGRKFASVILPPYLRRAPSLDRRSI